MTDEHRHEFHDALEEIRGEIVRLGAMTAETIGRGTEALLTKDLHALQNPIAGDLRFLVSSMRIVSELERSADLVVNICKAARRLYDIEFEPRLRGLIYEMSSEAQMLTQNRVQDALPRLPEDVQRLGVQVRKSTPNILLAVHLYSPDSSRDLLYTSNYATLHVKDVLARLPGVGDVQIQGNR